MAIAQMSLHCGQSIAVNAALLLRCCFPQHIFRAQRISTAPSSSRLLLQVYVSFLIIAQDIFRSRRSCILASDALTRYTFSRTYRIYIYIPGAHLRASCARCCGSPCVRRRNKWQTFARTNMCALFCHISAARDLIN